MDMVEVERSEDCLLFTYRGEPTVKVGPLRGTSNAWGVYRVSPNSPVLSHMGTYMQPAGACACALQECYHRIADHALKYITDRLKGACDLVDAARRDD